MVVRRLRALVAASVASTVTALALAGGDEVVARVGPETVTRAALEVDLASIPHVQLATYGATPADQKKNYLERVVVPDLLFTQAAEAGKLGDRPDVRARVLSVYRSAITDAFRREAAGQVTDDDVARYYEQNKARFSQPERVQIWRILCAAEDEARQLIALAKKPDGGKNWPDLAREHSRDKATYERGGDLGLVAADGQSSEAPVHVDPAVVAAARKVKDGEVVPEPVAEADGFAVVWRRGTQPASDMPLARAAAGIRQLLTRQRVEGAIDALLASLREGHLRDLSEDAVEAPVFKTPAAAPSARIRAGGGSSRAAGRPQPSSTPGGVLR